MKARFGTSSSSSENSIEPSADRRAFHRLSTGGCSRRFQDCGPFANPNTASSPRGSSR